MKTKEELQDIRQALAYLQQSTQNVTIDRLIDVLTDLVDVVETIGENSGGLND